MTNDRNPLIPKRLSKKTTYRITFEEFGGYTETHNYMYMGREGLMMVFRPVKHSQTDVYDIGIYDDDNTITEFLDLQI